MEDEGTPLSQVIDVRGDSSSPQSTSLADLDESSAEEPVVEENSTPQSFHKLTDMPPGEDLKSENPTAKSTGSLVGSILGRHKRSLKIGIRGSPLQPPAGGLHKSPYYRPIGGKHRDKGMMYYDVLIKKVFKGKDKVRNTRGTFVDASNPKRLFARIYFSSHLGRDLEPGVAYMLSGKIMDNDLVLPSRGGWLEKWTDLSVEEKRGLHGKYADNCDCEIRFCIPGYHCKMVQSSLPPTRCAWELRNFREPSRDCGAKHNLCLKYQNACQWTVGKGFHPCLHPPGLVP